MKRTTLTWAIAALLLGGGRLGAGSLDVQSANAAPSKPDWCGSYASPGDTKAKWIDGYMQSEPWSDRVRNYIAVSACDAPNDAARQAQTEKYRLAYMKDFGLTAADFHDMVVLYMNKDEPQTQKNAYCKSIKGPSDAPKPTREINGVWGFGAGCGMKMGLTDSLYWVDKPNVPEVLRASLVGECINTREDFGDNYKSALLCWPDIDALDRGKLEAELKAPKYNAYARIAYRETFGQSKLLADGWKARAQALAAKDPGMKNVLFDAPAAAVTAYNAAYTAHKEALDMAYALDEQHEDGTVQKGCSLPMRKHLAAYVAEKKPTDFEKMRDVISDQVGFPIVSALIRCETLDGNQVAAKSLHIALSGDVKAKKDGNGKPPALVYFKGPRYAAYYAAAAAFGEVSNTKRALPFKSLPSPSPVASKLLMDAGIDANQGLSFTSAGSENGAPTRGIIATAKPSGKNLLLTFKKDPVKIWEQECSEDRGRWVVESDGSIGHPTYCRYSGKSHIEMRTVPDVLIPSVFADGITPGKNFLFFANEGVTPRLGHPAVLSSDKDGKNQIAALGMPLGGGSAQAAAPAAATGTGSAKPPTPPAKPKKKK